MKKGIIFFVILISTHFTENNTFANQDPNSRFQTAKANSLCLQLRQSCSRVLCSQRLDEGIYRLFEKTIEAIRKDAKASKNSLQNYLDKKEKILLEIAGFKNTPEEINTTIANLKQALNKYREQLNDLVQNENPDYRMIKLTEGAIEFTESKVLSFEAQLTRAESTLRNSEGNENILNKLFELKELDSANLKLKNLLENIDSNLFVLSKLIHQQNQNSIVFRPNEFDRKNFLSITESGFFEFLIPRIDFVSEFKNAGVRSNENYFLVRNYVSIGDGKFKRLLPDRRITRATELSQEPPIQSYTLDTNILSLEGVKRDMDAFFKTNSEINANSIQVRPPSYAIGNSNP